MGFGHKAKVPPVVAACHVSQFLLAGSPAAASFVALVTDVTDAPGEWLWRAMAVGALSSAGGAGMLAVATLFLNIQSEWLQKEILNFLKVAGLLAVYAGLLFLTEGA